MSRGMSHLWWCWMCGEVAAGAGAEQSRGGVAKQVQWPAVLCCAVLCLQDGGEGLEFLWDLVRTIPMPCPAVLRCAALPLQDGDEGVAVESCEFWSAFCESQIESDVLRPFLPRLLPVLLKNMVWEEWDEEVQVGGWEPELGSGGSK